MRRYQPIWNRIKEENSATVSIDPHMHSRLIEAVKKERQLDLGWKLLIAEENKTFKLSISIKGNFIEFTLIETFPPNINNL